MKYQELLKKWEQVSFYKTKTARSALARFACWLDLRQANINKMTPEEKLLTASDNCKHKEDLNGLCYFCGKDIVSSSGE